MNNKNKFYLVYCLDNLIKLCLVFMMITIALLTFYQVIMRYGFNQSSSCSEEAIRFTFIWCSFLGVAMGVREKSHIGISILVELFNQKVQRYVEVVGYLAIMIFAGYLMYYGWKVVIATSTQTSPALGVPMSLIYLSVPVMACLIFFYSFIEIIHPKNN